jgi:hypothetical protein
MKEVDGQLKQQEVAQRATEVSWHLSTHQIQTKAEVIKGRKVHDGLWKPA